MPSPTPVEELDELGTMIRDARRVRGLSQDALAEQLGIVQSHLSAIERGPAGVDASLIVRLENVLDLDAGAIARAGAVRGDSTRKRHLSSQN